MNVEFTETKSFTEVVEEYFGSDESFRLFQQMLNANPEAGRVMQGCGGLRKVGWPDPRRGKGKRGGLRVIYLHVPQVGRIGLIDVYDKDEADVLSSEEKKVLRELAAEVRSDLLLGS